MPKRITLIFDDPAYERFENLLSEVNNSFDAGKISPSDLISEIIVSSRLDIRALQLKHSDLRRSLRALAGRPEIDIETAIRVLSELRGPATSKRRSIAAGAEENAH